MNVQTLKSELDGGHPVTGAYSVDDQAAADELNAANITVERESLSGSAIYNTIVPAEFSALDASQRQQVRDIFGLGDSIDVRTGTNVRTVLLDLFGPASQTRTNLVALAQESISRAAELGLGRVEAKHVRWARKA